MKTLNEKYFAVIDLNSGTYLTDQLGHELYNLDKNKVDGKYYGYCPPSCVINIEKLGANKNDLYIENIMIIYVRKIQNSNDREIVAFCDNATAYKFYQTEPSLKRYIKKNGKLENCNFGIKSDYMHDLRNYNLKFIIHLADYSTSMFRSQRFYKGKYPELDKSMLDYLEKYLYTSEYCEDIEFQAKILDENSIKAKASSNDSKEEPLYYTGANGRQVSKKSRIAKAALVEAKFKCEGNDKHNTFTTTKGDIYMEGHHLIPCTCTNTENFWNNHGINIDCLENIVSLCPTCHRLVHFGSEKERTKLLTKLYNNQATKMKKAGIKISLDELLKLYRI